MIDRERFWSHVSFLDDSPETCWVWVGPLRDDGRARFCSQGRDMRAHWAAWEIQHGEPVPANSRLEQECNQPQCVRHWKLVGPAKKLTPVAVRDILRSMLGPTALAKKWGVTYQAVLYHRAKHRTDLRLHHTSGSV